jgi:prevent-host-death family protein
MKKAPTPMTNVVSALTARTQFGQIMRRASSKNERFVVDRRGEPSVIIMSVKDYVSTFAPEPEWLAKVRAQSVSNGTDKLTMNDINEIVAEVRQGSPKKKLASRGR